MAVKKEFLCFAHGRFDSTKAVCPHGCTTVERRYYTPVGTRTVAAGIDKTLDSIAKDYRLTDMNNHNGTTAARVIDTKASNRQTEFEKHVRTKFGAQTLVNTRNGVGGWGAIDKKMGALAAVQGIGASGPTTVEQMRPAMEAQKPRVTYIRDPDPSSIQRVKAA